MARYGHIEGLDSKTSVNDPVSDADRAAERDSGRPDHRRTPADGLLGEEGAARESTSGLRWVIDPLDGTVNYLYQLDNFSVSVAVEDADGALVGVSQPDQGRAYQAIRGGGARWTAIHFGQGPRFDGAGVDRDRVRVQRRAAPDPGRADRELLPKVRDIRRIGPAALDLCTVAAGSVDGYFEEGKCPSLDVAAGGLIAREAGAGYANFTPTGAYHRLPGGRSRSVR